jgi:sulfite oxidase
MNAEWTGPLLRDVLVHAGLNVRRQKDGYEGLHVQMECNATQVQDDEWYGSSVPLDVVMDEEREVVLALEVSCLPTFTRYLHVWGAGEMRVDMICAARS